MAQPPLTSPDRVTDYLRTQLSPEATSVIERFIRYASDLIRDHTGRRFTSPPVLETREIRSYGYTQVYIDEVFADSDVLAVTDGNGISVPYDLDFGDEIIRKGATLSYAVPAIPGVIQLPDDHADNFIREIRGDLGTLALPAKIRVTANFGWPQGAIPSQIEFAATRAAAIWFKEEIAHYSEDTWISRGVQFEPDDLPPLVKPMLNKKWLVPHRLAIRG